MNKNMMKRAMALSCAFAVSLAAMPETMGNAQVVNEKTESSNVSTQGIMHTMETTTKKVAKVAKVANETDLRNAINNGITNIKLTASFKIESCITIPQGKTFTISSDTTSNRVIGTTKALARLFLVNGTVTFKNITLKGGYTSDNKDYPKTTNTVLAVADGGSATLNDSKVTLSSGNLVRVAAKSQVTAKNTTFVSASGKYGDNGGAIRIESNGTFTMSGTSSKISDNPYGGVYVAKGGTFNMNGGEISGNKGGAGTTSGSSGVGMGGGVFNAGTFNFVAGTITGNTAPEYGKNVCNAGTMDIKAGVSLNSMYLTNTNTTFSGAPKEPVTIQLGFSVAPGTKIATCASGVEATACMKVNGQKIANDPKDATSIIVTQDYTITVDPNQANGKEKTSSTCAYNETITLPTSEEYTRLGYTLAGWQSSTDNSTLEPGETVDVVANATYTAVWSPKIVTVEYYDSDGTTKLEDDSYSFDEQSAYTIKDGTQKKGYTFLYWKDISSGETGEEIIKAGSQLSRTDRDDTLKLKAVYEEKTIDIKFELNMDTATMEKKEATVNYSDELQLASYKPEARGYDFDGWYTDEKCTGKAVTSISPEKLGTDVTIKLYAKWKAADIPVTYDVTVVNSAKSVKYDEKLTITSYTPSKSGYTFKGWCIGDNTSKIYVAGDTICPKELGLFTIEFHAIFVENPTPTATPEQSSTTSGKTTTQSGKTPTNASGSATSATVEDEDIPSSGASVNFKLSTSKKTLGVGDQFRINFFTNEAYEISADTDVISVNSIGLVTALKPGTAKVEIRAGGITKACKVTVKKAPKAANIKVKTKKVKKGKTISVKPTFTGGTYCLSLKYSSSNKKVAKVTSKGKVKGLKKGTAKITIKCSTGAKKVVKIKVV